MQINQPIWSIGLMSGTSADAVDAALLQTDGENITAHAGGISLAYDAKTAEDIHALMQGEGDVDAVSQALTNTHIKAVKMLLAQVDILKQDIAVIGFHGQTIRHDPQHGITRQIGDARLLGNKTGLSVVADFRSNDVAQGGQGAPLAPLYHQALAAASGGLARPLAILNLGGVANLTYLGDSIFGQSQQDILAFDCGPANAMMDDVMRQKCGMAYDENGALAASGKVQNNIVEAYLQNNFFQKAPPKSLDRNQFDLSLVGALSRADALATLAAFSVQAVACGVENLPLKPQKLLVTGGGRHNAHIMQALQNSLQIPVRAVEAVGWDGDLLEAEAFAYLAVRSMRGLPLSLPVTTGGRQPVTGGVFYPV
jgi:anhydro-N-acetylmuramic acid kinase